MLDQHEPTVTQAALSIPSTLLAHPELQAGLQDGYTIWQEGFFWQDHQKQWTEKEIIQFVSRELSAKVYYCTVRGSRRVEGAPPAPSYLHILGYVIGYLDQILAAQQAAHQQERKQPS